MKINIGKKLIAISLMGLVLVTSGCSRRRPADPLKIAHERLGAEAFDRGLFDTAYKYYSSAREENSISKKGRLRLLDLSTTLSPKKVTEHHTFATEVVRDGGSMKAYDILARSEFKAEHYDRATVYWRNSLSFPQTEKVKALIDRNIGLSYFYQKDYFNAHQYFQQYLKIAKKIGLEVNVKDQSIIQHLHQIQPSPLTSL